MKLLSDYRLRGALPHPMKIHAFTLVEMMTAMAVFTLLVMAMVSLQIFGFKINSLTTSKLKFTQSSLKALGQIQGQVRGASSVVVGNGTSLASFSPTTTSGNALMIYPAAGGNNLLYLSTNTGKLYEIFSATPNQETVASQLTNKVVFQTVDYNGNNSSSASVEHYAVKMTLNFCQTNYQNNQIGNTVYDYFTFQTVMTPRTQP